MDNYNNIDQQLLLAYQRTTYRLKKTTIVIRLDAVNSDLDSFLVDNNAFNWVFMSADNPQSKQALPADNEAYRKSLLNHCKKQKWPVWPGIGIPPTDDWPAEESWLILDINKETGDALAKQFDQKAYLWGWVNGKAQLRIP